MVMRTERLMRVRIKYLHNFRIELRHELVVCVDFPLQLGQSFYVAIIELLEIITFKFLGLALLAVGALALLAFAPFIKCGKKLESSIQVSDNPDK